MRNATLGRVAQRWSEYLRGTAAFDLALVSLFVLVALGFRHAFVAGLWIGIATSIVLRLQGGAIVRVPRAVLLRGARTSARITILK